MHTSKTILRLLLSITAVIGATTVHALDVRDFIDRAVTLIEDHQTELARSYLAPALIAPRLSAGERSRAYYLQGFSFMADNMPVSARKDFNRALEFNPNNAVVILELGILHAAGRGTVQDEALALSLFERAANLGYARANFYLGRAYMYGRGAEKNIEAARTALTAAAKEEHTFAMLNLASSYRIQHVANPQPDLALAWYEKALAAGEPGALLSIGFMHANGEFGTPDMVRSVGYFQRALDEGVQTAAVHLAYAYMTGTGVKEDYKRALALYTGAADAGIAASYVGLGHLFEYGLGVKKNMVTARQWYEKGASADEYDAMQRLVSLHLGEDTSEDRALALRWSRRAATNGMAQSLNDYAWLLATSKFEGLRNGTLALDQATKAVEDQPTAPFLDTLAAAYAELGNFDEAITIQHEAIAAIAEADGEIRAQLEERLQYYERNEAWRE